VEQWAEQIERDISDHAIFVYAKGEKNAAACRFSHRVMQIFNELGEEFEVRNVFSDRNLRPAICAFTNWPTIPQVFVNGTFVGGCDILSAMYESGELKKLLE
jgi:monothiol glutaredoxin